MTTADSSVHLALVIGGEEASQIPEHTFLGLFSKFSIVNFGLIGDTKQLHPYQRSKWMDEKDFGPTQIAL